MRKVNTQWRSDKIERTGTRLKPARIDPLTQVGLPSKGDTSLNDFIAQERYYDEIVRRHRTLIVWGASDASNIEVQLSSLSVSDANAKSSRQPVGAEYDAELATILMAMRKLREAIVSTKRADVFVQNVYMFIIHAAIVARDFEAYHPAILHMLYRVHRTQPLGPERLQELIGLHILDVACRQSDLAAARAAVCRFHCDNTIVLRVVNSLVHNDWLGFWTALGTASKYQKHLIHWAEDTIRRHALNAIGRSYFSVDKVFLQRSTGQMAWDEVKRTYGLTWTTEGELIIIRKTKGK